MFDLAKSENAKKTLDKGGNTSQRATDMKNTNWRRNE